VGGTRVAVGAGVGVGVAVVAVWTSASSHAHYKPSGVGRRAGAVGEGIAL